MIEINENYAPKPQKKKLVAKEVVYQLAAIMCTNEEISQVLGITPSQLKNKYQKIIDKGRAEGKKSLRRAQFEKALTGDVRMLIFLGKNYCGQSDTGDQGEDNQALPWEEEK